MNVANQPTRCKLEADNKIIEQGTKVVLPHLEVEVTKACKRS